MLTRCYQLTSRRYGAHLTKEEAEALVAPHPDSVEAIESWLQYHGINPANTIHRSGGGDWITLQVSVAQAERMLGAKYNVYQHVGTSQRIVRTLGYSLPRSLHSHVDVVAPTTYFGTLRSMRSTSFLQPDIEPAEKLISPDLSAAAVPASCGTTITPACLRALYNTSTYVPQATSTNKLGVAGYLDEFANRADLQVRHQSMCYNNRTEPPANPCHRHSLTGSELMLWAQASLLFLLMAAEMTKTILV